MPGHYKTMIKSGKKKKPLKKFAIKKTDAKRKKK